MNQVEGGCVESSAHKRIEVMRTELEQEYEKVMKKFRASNIRPKMELTITNGKSIGSFDLRSLNQNIVNNKKVDQ